MEGQGRNIFIAVVLFLLISGGLAFSYYMIVAPEKEKAQDLQAKIEAEENVLTVVQQKISELARKPEVDTLALQHHVPIDPMLDHVILDLIEVERQSNSEILEVLFEIQELTGFEALQSEREENEEDAQEEFTWHEIQGTLLVNSPSVERMKQLIQAIENLERIYRINSIHYSEGSGPWTYTVEFTTYFAPQYDGVFDKIPGKEFPEGSGKVIPFRVINVSAGSES